DTFNRNSGSDTQLAAVVRAVLLDPEARGDRKNADNYGHLKEPVLYVNNLLRLFNAQSDDRTQQSDGYLNVNANGDNFLTLAQGQARPTPAAVLPLFPARKGGGAGHPAGARPRVPDPDNHDSPDPGQLHQLLGVLQLRHGHGPRKGPPTRHAPRRQPHRAAGD